MFEDLELWLLEQAVQQYHEQGVALEVPALLAEAAALGPQPYAVDVTSPTPTHTDDVLAELARQCAAADLPVPLRPAEVARCVVQSLALAYARTVEQCQELTGEPVDTVRMTGGGSRSALLRQLTADACDRPVQVGTVEATSLGSIAVQAVADGALPGLDAACEVLGGASVPPVWWQQLNASVPSYQGPA